MIAYVAENIQLPDWKNKYSGLIALGSISEGPDKDKLGEIINQALASLLVLFSDKSSKVREALCWVFRRLSEHHAQIFNQP